MNISIIRSRTVWFTGILTSWIITIPVGEGSITPQANMGLEPIKIGAGETDL